MAAVRNVDALVAVIQVFAEGAPHVLGEVNPWRDLELIHSELVFADWEVIEKRIERLGAKKKKENEGELKLLQRCREALEAESRLTNLSFTGEEAELLRGFQFLTLKPLLMVLNLDAEGFKTGFPGKEGSLPGCRRKACPSWRFQPGLNRKSPNYPQTTGYYSWRTWESPNRALTGWRGLFTGICVCSPFFTVGEDEVKAWTIIEGTTAKKAAGKDPLRY